VHSSPSSLARFAIFDLCVIPLSTMHLNHPFGSWGEQSQGQSWSGSPVYGALPYPSEASNFTTFYFTSFNPNVLNCTIVGPQAQVSHRIVTDNHMPGYTVIKNAEGKNVSLIEWQAHPMIEIRGLLTKQHVKSWLGLTQDRRCAIFFAYAYGDLALTQLFMIF